MFHRFFLPSSTSTFFQQYSKPILTMVNAFCVTYVHTLKMMNASMRNNNKNEHIFTVLHHFSVSLSKTTTRSKKYDILLNASQQRDYDERS